MKETWKSTKVGPGAVVKTCEVSEEIQAKMPPPGSKPFTQVSFAEFIKQEISSILSPKK